MQPTTKTQAPYPTTQRPPGYRSRNALIVGVVAFGVLLSACGGSSDSASPTTTSAPTASDPTAAPPSETTQPTAERDVDVCAEITEAQVSEALGGVTLTGSEPMPGNNPSCQYFVTISGLEGAAVQVQLFPADYYDGQKQMQSNAVAAPGLTEAFSVDGSLVFARTDAGTVTVGAGYALDESGSPATLDQLIAVTKLGEGL